MNHVKIVITIAGKEISVTPEELRDLREAIDTVFPPEKVVQREYVPYPVYPYRRWYEPIQPMWKSSSGEVSLSAQKLMAAQAS